MKKLLFLILIIIFFIGMLIYGAHTIYHGFTNYETDVHGARIAVARLSKEELAKKNAEWLKLKNEITRELKEFSGTVGLVIKDLDLNWEIVSNEDVPMPSASIVKIPIMMACFNASQDGIIDLKAKIRITNSIKSPGSGLLKNAASGTEVTIEELITLMITSSDNTAANILIDRIGMENINRYFSQMGLKNTNLVRKMMDFKARSAGVENYTTARDMASLLEKLYRNQFLSPAISKQCLEIMAGQKVNDRIPKKLPGTVIVAHKTGLENGLCHDAGIVYTDKGNFLISVVVKHNNKTAVAAKGLIATISLLTYLYHNGG